MKTLYAVKFISSTETKDTTVFDAMNMHIDYMIGANEYGLNSASDLSKVLSCGAYNYYADIDLKTGDLVIIENLEPSSRNRSTYALGVVQGPGDIEKARESQRIIAKLSYGDTFKKERDKARKRRLKKAMELHIAQVAETEQFAKLAEHDPVLKTMFEEFKQL